jgi:DNA-binding PadR family transcriptional regulator
MLSAADREIRLGLWRIHILHHAAHREVWGTWLLAELAEHGHKLSPGTLYPAMARMERHGWIRRSGRAAHARARQSFRITREGRRLLAAIRRDVSQLYAEVVVGLAPSRATPAATAPSPSVRGKRSGRKRATRRQAQWRR